MQLTSIYSSYYHCHTKHTGGTTEFSDLGSETLGR